MSGDAAQAVAQSFNTGFQQGASGVREAALTQAELYKQKLAKEASIAINDADNQRMLAEKQMEQHSKALGASFDQMDKVIVDQITQEREFLKDPLKWEASRVNEARDNINRLVRDRIALAGNRERMEPFRGQPETAQGYVTEAPQPSTLAREEAQGNVTKRNLENEVIKRQLASGTYPGGPSRGSGSRSASGGGTGESKPVDLKQDETAVRQFHESLNTLSGGVGDYRNWKGSAFAATEHANKVHAHRVGDGKDLPPKEDHEYWDAINNRDQALLKFNEVKTAIAPQYSAAISGIQRGFLDSEAAEASKVMTEVLTKVPGNVYSIDNYDAVINELKKLRDTYQNLAESNAFTDTERQRLQATLTILQRLGGALHD